MEILKKSILLTVLQFFVLTAFCQKDLALQRAFAESYSLETKFKYNDAVSILSPLYDENSYELNLRMGWLYYNAKNYTQSQSHYQKAVKLKPYSIEAKLGLVKPMAALESWDKVTEQYEEILKIDAQNYTANYWLGVINYNKKKYQQAIKLLEQLVNMYPFDYDANHILAWSYLNAGRNNDAKIIFQKALLIRPGDASCIEGLGKIK
jgi:tetratricopeptide (TPR) repeat protein